MGMRMRYDWIAGSRSVAVMILFSLTLLISGNALFMQPQPHPAPLFFTRSAETANDRGRPAPLPVARGSAAAKTASRPKERPGKPARAASEIQERADPVVLAIQQALADAAYGPLTVDGVAGKQTADAIRRFQLDQGLAVTGTIDDLLISRLISVGAMAQR